jgi:GNAT superfamily N-acetyltransferase
MRTIESVTELPEDSLLRWAVRDPDRAWVSDDGHAFAVAGAGLSLRDRLAVRGPAESLVPLVEKVLAEVGPTYRPIGDRPAVAALTAALPRLRAEGDFGWMDRTAAGPERASGTTSSGTHSGTHGGTHISSPAPGEIRSAVPGPRAGWLGAAEEGEAAALLMRSFPSSYAIPGVPGVQRWAGVRDGSGRLVAVGAHAWSTPGVGFLAGIAVDRTARGLGLGRTVFGFVLTEALASYGTAALMVDDDNHAAIALYRALGLTYRPVSAASVGG